jgi:formylglycine-generating enzyme
MKKLTILTILLSFSLLSWKNPQPISKKLKKILGDKWAFIPSGQAKIGETLQNVNEFYILKTEASNLDYLTFLASFEDKNSVEYKSALPDTTVWSNKMGKNESFVNQYFRYPGFKQYPVVGISHENAMLYCKWLEANINSQLENDVKVTVRLPSENEWIRAARGSNHPQLYPWEDSDFKDKKGKSLANHKKEIKSDFVGIITTTEVKAYLPNQFGIYQMSGNLAEMLDEPQKVKGGSWNMPAESLKIDNSEKVDYPSNNVGFRPVMVIVSK